MNEIETKQINFDGEFEGLVWPEIDVFDLDRYQDDKKIHLRTFRWRADTNGGKAQRKGVVFMLHGYGASNANMCLLAKNLALNLYDVYALDMRGQGESGGMRGNFETEETIYNDQWALIFEACARDSIDT